MLLKELRYVIMIDECGSISKAAENLFISQPALSKYLKNLESYLDVNLFERIGNRLIVTDAGSKYIEAAKSMLAIFDNMSNELTASDNLIRGVLRVGTSNSRSPLLLSKTVPIFHSMFPNVNIQLFEQSSYKLENQLADGMIDLLITKGPLTNVDKFIADPLFTEELLISLPKSRSLDIPSETSPGSSYPWLDISLLQDESFILLKPGQYTRALADKLFSDYGFFPKEYVATGNIETAMRMSANGIGPTFVPSFFARSRYADDLDLDFFSVGKEHNHLYSTFNIIYRQDMQLTRYMKAFIALLHEQFGNGGSLQSDQFPE